MAVTVDPGKCNGCGDCVPDCPEHAIEIVNDVADIDDDTCSECGGCIDLCPRDAISL